jgi:hypothetical protein
VRPGAHLTFPLAAAFLAGCASFPLRPFEGVIRVAPDGRSFEVAPSGERFVAWGFNYTRGDRLLEDFWEAEWPEIRADFAEMKALGANVVRIHLQLAKFMRDAETPDEASLERLEAIAALAEETGLYLDVTGLGAYRWEDTPGWYFALGEEERWAAHATFWEAVASRLARSPAIFCYDLMNEPIVPAVVAGPGQLLTGEFGGFYFIQLITLDPAGRAPEEIARRWIRRMTEAIRRHDERHLITLGALPPTPELGYFSGFAPALLAEELDFVSVHAYPGTPGLADAAAIVRGFAAGKPVVVEETFLLYVDGDAFEAFFRSVGDLAAGWIGFYWGEPPESLRPPRDVRQALELEWLELFRRLGPPGH